MEIFRPYSEIHSMISSTLILQSYSNIFLYRNIKSVLLRHIQNLNIDNIPRYSDGNTCEYIWISGIFKTLFRCIDIGISAFSCSGGQLLSHQWLGCLVSMHMWMLPGFLGFGTITTGETRGIGPVTFLMMSSSKGSSFSSSSLHTWNGIWWCGCAIGWMVLSIWRLTCQFFSFTNTVKQLIRNEERSLLCTQGFTVGHSN